MSYKEITAAVIAAQKAVSDDERALANHVEDAVSELWQELLPAEMPVEITLRIRPVVQASQEGETPVAWDGTVQVEVASGSWSVPRALVEELPDLGKPRQGRGRR